MSQYDSPVRVIGGGPWMQISTGSQLTCGITSSNTAWCWGDLSYGLPTPQDTPIPKVVPRGLRWLQISAGGQYACAVQFNTSGWCWGINEGGRLGTNTTNSTIIPMQVAGNATWLQMSASYPASPGVGGQHSCGLFLNGTAACWGNNDFGQLGDGTRNSSLVPVLVASNLTWSSISVGPLYSCGLSNGTAYCWGYNPYYGPRGVAAALASNRTNTFGSVPKKVVFPKTWNQISSGAYHICGVTSDNSTYCWGANGEGMLGNNGVLGSTQPYKIAASGPWLQVSAGLNHTCAIRAVNESVWCWGNGTLGALGTAYETSKRAPVQVLQVSGQAPWGVAANATLPPTPPSPPFPPLAVQPPPPPPPIKTGVPVAAVAGGVVGGVVAGAALAVLAVVLFLRHRRKKQALAPATSGKDEEWGDDDSEEPRTPPKSPALAMVAPQTPRAPPPTPATTAAPLLIGEDGATPAQSRSALLRWISEQEAASGSFLLKWLAGRQLSNSPSCENHLLRPFEFVWNEIEVVSAAGSLGTFGQVLQSNLWDGVVAAKVLVDAKAIAAQAAMAADREDILAAAAATGGGGDVPESLAATPREAAEEEPEAIAAVPTEAIIAVRVHWILRLEAVPLIVYTMQRLCVEHHLLMYFGSLLLLLCRLLRCM